MRGILFDKDGTLIDFDASWSGLYRELALELSGGDPNAADALLAIGGMHVETGRCRAGSALAAGNTIDIARCWFPALNGAPFDTMVKRIDGAFYANGIRYSVALPGVAETLAALTADGVAMGVATSDGTAATRAALAMLGLEKYLPHVFGYDSVARPKPAPDIIHAFAAATRLPLEEIAVVGDNRHDLEMARAAGSTAIGVCSGTSSAEDLADLADAVLPDIRALPEWLRSQP
jgi:phosphoglycolate phosphatase